MRPEKEKSQPGRPRIGLDRRAARIAEAEQLGDLVEGLADGVVDGRPEPQVTAHAAHEKQLAMAARDQQKQKRVADRARQAGAQGMALQVVDGEEGLAGRRRDRLAHGRADHDAADQAGSCGRGHPVQIAEAQTGCGHGAADQPVQMVEMGAGGNLGHDAFVGPVVVNLGQQGFGENVRRSVR